MDHEQKRTAAGIREAIAHAPLPHVHRARIRHRNHMAVPWHEVTDCDDMLAIDADLDDKSSIICRAGLLLLAGGTGSWRVRDCMNKIADVLGVTIDELFEMAASGEVLPISSLCTVFAESEVINYIGEGQKRENIAAGVVDSVAAKVAQLAQRKDLPDHIILTGGLSHSIYFTDILSKKIGKKVEPTENGRYAGALGASYLAEEKKKRV